MITIRKKLIIVESFLNMFNYNDWVNINTRKRNPYNGSEVRMFETVNKRLITEWIKESGGSVNVERLFMEIDKHIRWSNPRFFLDDSDGYKFELRLKVDRVLENKPARGNPSKYTHLDRAIKLFNVFAKNRPNARVTFGTTQRDNDIIMFFNCPDLELMNILSNSCVRFLMMVIYVNIMYGKGGVIKRDSV